MYQTRRHPKSVYDQRGWSPARLGGLVLWLDPSVRTTLWTDDAATDRAGDGDPVGRWDMDPRIDAPISHFSTDTADQRPTLNLGDLHGQPTITPDAADDRLDHDTGYVTSTSDGITAYVVGRVTGSGSSNFIFDQGGYGGEGFGFGLSTSKVHLYTPRDSGGDITSKSHDVSGLSEYWMRCEVEFGAEQRLDLLGGAYTTSDAITAEKITEDELNTGDPARIFSQAKSYDGSSSYKGDLAALWIWDRLLTDAEQGRVEEYIRQTWGL